MSQFIHRPDRFRITRRTLLRGSALAGGVGVLGGTLVDNFWGKLYKDWTITGLLSHGTGLPVTPIAFLGVAIPHLCRGLLRTSDHRSLVPATILMGAIVALTAQILSLVPSLLTGNAGVFPLNAITSLIGAPVVVIVLMRYRRGAFTG